MGLIETPEFNNQEVCPNNFVHKHTQAHIQYAVYITFLKINWVLFDSRK